MLQGRLIITDFPNTQHCRRGGKTTISGPFDVKHERDPNYTGGKEKASLVCFFSRFVDIVSCYYYVWRYGFAFA